MTGSYTNIAISSGLYVGGVIGTSGPDITMADLYAVGSVSGSLYAGGISTYAPNVLFTLPDSPGIYNLYIKFYSSTGVHSSVLKRTVTLDSPKDISTITKEINQTLVAKRTGPYLFTRNLRKGMSGKDVIELQKFLNSHDSAVATAGPGSSGQETSYFGNATAKAVTHFQELHASQVLKPFGLIRGTGMFMNMTRALVNKIF